MTEQKVKNNSRKRLYFDIALVGAIVGVFGFFQTQIDRRIENHPKIIRLETQTENIDDDLNEIKGELKELNRKIDKLLEDR